MRRYDAPRLELLGVVPIARVIPLVTLRGMSYPSDLTDDQLNLLKPVFNAPAKRSNRHWRGRLHPRNPASEPWTSASIMQHDDGPE